MRAMSGGWFRTPAALIALIAVATLTLTASAVGQRSAPAADAKRPNYLTPIGALVHHGYLPFPALLGDHGDVGVPAGVPQPPSEPDRAEAARQAPAIAPYQGAAGTLTAAAIASLALRSGCDPGAAVIATAVAMAESGGSPSAQGDIGLMTPVWDWSAGLWQIRGLRAERNTGGIRDSIANQNAEHNAEAMYVISAACTDWTPWSTYNSSAYLQFMPLAEQATRYAVAYYNAHGHHYPPVPAPDPTATLPTQGVGGSGPTRQGGSAGPTAGATREHSATPRPTHSSTRVAQPQPSATAPAAPQPSPTRSSSSHSLLPLPLPTTKLPIKTSTLPLPLPTTTLPLPLPTLSLPGLP